MPPPHVAIIGAGPAGLVTAKTMLEAGLTSLTLFEQTNHIGGMWAPNSCWDSLRTNISRYSCSFSDFPWPPNAPLFPSLLEMHTYLSDYATKHLDPSKHLSLSSTVHSLRPSPSLNGKWVVTYSTPSSSPNGLESSEFDHVVIATGFFSTPHVPNIPGLSDAGFPGPVLHSAHYRSPEAFEGRHVAVVGGSLSAVEIAADVALRRASRVTHVAPRPFWVLPRIIPLVAPSPGPLPPRKGPPPPTFFPLDLALYRRSKSSRRSPCDGETLFRDASANRQINKLFHAISGGGGEGGSQDFAPSTDEEYAMPAVVTVSDTYPALARGDARCIAHRRGRVTRAVRRDDGSSALVLEDGTEVPEVEAVVLCTGFRPSLPFLEEEVLAKMKYDPTDLFCPLLLHKGTFHPSMRGVAFVGMYRGPLMGVMELQARWVAGVFNGTIKYPSEEEQWGGIALEGQVRGQVPRPQFPHADVAGLSDGLAAEVGGAVLRHLAHELVVPAVYGAGEVADAALREVEAACVRFEGGELVPRAVFRALEGEWKMSRKVQSHLPSSPSGTVIGSARFTRSNASEASPSSPSSSPEYLYREEGEFFMPKGKTRVWREYVYAYNAEEDRLDTYFVVEKARGGFFHALRFLPAGGAPGPAGEASGGENDGRWHAVGRHPCGRDMYEVSYHFDFRGVELREFVVEYVVKGPEKDYVSTATYSRQAF